MDWNIKVFCLLTVVRLFIQRCCLMEYFAYCVNKHTVVIYSVMVLAYCKCVCVHTCRRDISMFLVQSWALNMIPGQNTVRHHLHMNTHVYTRCAQHVCVKCSESSLTWTCLQSWPLAGSRIRWNVIGHFNDTLMAVCSTPSSQAPPTDTPTLLKFLFTAQRHSIYICVTLSFILKIMIFHLTLLSDTFSDAVFSREESLLQ